MIFMLGPGRFSEINFQDLPAQNIQDKVNSTVSFVLYAAKKTGSCSDKKNIQAQKSLSPPPKNQMVAPLFV